jgi:acyl dehydratase
MPESGPAKGDIVPAVTLEITLRRLIVNAAASWDIFPGHVDRDYARAHGHEDVFANTSLILAFADRVITDWAGPRTRIARRRLSMGRPVHPGDTLRGEGVVTDVRRDGDLLLVDVEIDLSTQRGPCAQAVATIEVPATASPAPALDPSYAQ